ncbi:hypothetical protein KsCSTR_29060 [Candidatus Kuenenia stuttgartiensis]|uniref:Uncharacterized protein n=1 Tax=Kuenenia stuttgartiensis TaxID=174633 RepID=Q1Q5U6_KUEST|nr:hypothetical protein KsCSTR_29060 [Candidatus Kuenenia stuttgartiensis]CAJ75391.1 unknown protein [Candidatus Kuenenia stuttgartiensis]
METQNLASLPGCLKSLLRSFSRLIPLPHQFRLALFFSTADDCLILMSMNSISRFGKYDHK